MSIALHDFLVRQLGIEAANINIVVDNASTQANVNRNILCNALAQIQKARSAHDSAPHSPRRTVSKIRFPGSPHTSAFEQPRSPIRNSPAQILLAPTKSPSRWETSVAVEGMRSPPPRQPKRVLSSKDLLTSRSDHTFKSNGNRFNSIVARIAALPLTDFDTDDEEETTSISDGDKLRPSISPVSVRDYCLRQQSDEALLSNLNSSIDDFATFED